MEENNRLQLIALVEARIRELEAELLASKTETDKDEDDQVKEPADPGLSISEPVNKKVLLNHQAELEQLNRNLKWLDSENAGYCDQCDCDIPIARLKAVLNTRLCIACAEKAGQ